MRWLVILAVVCFSILNTGCSTLADARLARGTGTARVYDTPQDAVWQALPYVIKEVGLDYVGDNRKDGYALAQRSLSAFSYGENVAIFVDPYRTPDRTIVEVVSKKTYALNVLAPNWEVTILEQLALSPQISRNTHGKPAATHSLKTLIPTPNASDSTPRQSQADWHPPSSTFADIDDVNAIPYLSDRGRARYKIYLSAPSPKAFVINQRGGWRWLSNDTEAMRKALATCLADAGAKCWLYAVDDNVVWQMDENKRISLQQLIRYKVVDESPGLP